jgi:hypothetical protein
MSCPFCVFKTKSHDIAGAGVGLAILLPLPSVCLDGRCGHHAWLFPFFTSA